MGVHKVLLVELLGRMVAKSRLGSLSFCVKFFAQPDNDLLFFVLAHFSEPNTPNGFQKFAGVVVKE